MPTGGMAPEAGNNRETGEPGGTAAALQTDVGPTVRQAVVLPPGASLDREAWLSEPIFGGQAYVYEAGLENRQSIVLIHGLGDNGARDWAQVIPELVKKYHVVTFDLPGFGHSSRQNVLYSPENYVKFVKWATSSLVTGRFVLIGHSLGGAIALRYAATHSQDLEMLILVDVAGILHRAVLGRYAMRPRPEPGSILSRLSDASLDKINNWTGMALEAIERVQMPVGKILASDRLRQNLLEGKPGTIASLALIEEDFGPIIEQSQTPTHIFWGEKDTVTPLRTGKLLAARLANADLKVIQGAAHVPMTQQTQAFNQALAVALRSAPSQSAPTRNPGQSHQGRQGYCQQEDNVIFQGTYDKIRIINCRDVQLTDVTSRSIHISDSSVRIENSAITGDTVGLEADGSTIEATALSVEADVAVVANHSRLDLAGTRLIGRKAVAQSATRASILFSVSHIRGPAQANYVHGLYRISATRRL